MSISPDRKAEHVRGFRFRLTCWWPNTQPVPQKASRRRNDQYDPCRFVSTGTTGLAVNIRRVYEVDIAPYQRSLGKGELGFVYRADMRAVFRVDGAEDADEEDRVKRSHLER